MKVAYRDNITSTLPRKGWSDFFHPARWGVKRVIHANNVPFLKGKRGTVYRRNLKPFRTGRKRSIFECQFRKEKRCNAQYEEYINDSGQVYYRKYKNPHSCLDPNNENKMKDEEAFLNPDSHHNMLQRGVVQQEVSVGPVNNNQQNEYGGFPSNNQQVRRPPPPQHHQQQQQQQQQQEHYRRMMNSNFALQRRQQQMNKALIQRLRIQGPPRLHKFFPDKGTTTGHNLVEIYCSFGTEYNNWIFNSQVNPTLFQVTFGNVPSAKVIEVTESRFGRLGHTLNPQSLQAAGVMILVRDRPHPPGPVKITVTYPVHGGTTRFITSQTDFVYVDTNLQKPSKEEGTEEVEDEDENEHGDENDGLFLNLKNFNASNYLLENNNDEITSLIEEDHDMNNNNDDENPFWNNENAKNEFGYNLLLYSCSQSLEMVRVLVEKRKFDLTVTDNFGNGVLHVSSFFKKLDIFDYLLYEMISRGLLEVEKDDDDEMMMMVLPKNTFGEEPRRPYVDGDDIVIQRNVMGTKEIKVRTKIAQITREIHKIRMKELKIVTIINDDDDVDVDGEEPKEAKEAETTTTNSTINEEEEEGEGEGEGEDEKEYSYFFERGKKYFEIRDYIPALSDFNDCCAQSLSIPQKVQGHYGKGNVLQSLGHAQSSIQEYDECIRLDPKFGEAYYGKGLAYKKLGKIKLSFMNFRRAIEIDPDGLGYSYYELGMMLHRYFGENGEAVEHITKCLELFPKFVPGLNGRGNIYRSLGKTKLALQDYQEALRINGEYIHAYNGRANVLLDSKAYDEANRNYDECLKRNKNYIYAYLGKGNICKAQRSYEKAQEFYKICLELNPNYVLAKRGLEECEKKIKMKR